MDRGDLIFYLPAKLSMNRITGASIATVARPSQRANERWIT